MYTNSKDTVVSSQKHALARVLLWLGVHVDSVHKRGCYNLELENPRTCSVAYSYPLALSLSPQPATLRTVVNINYNQ